MQRTITTLALAGALLLGWAPAVSAAKLLKPGMPFPAFSLKSHDGRVIDSEALRGRYYLVYFYPKANTSGCTKEACAFRDSWPEVQSRGLLVLGVSYDSPKANRAFAEKYHLPFPLLSDENKVLASQVGAKRALIPYPRRISYLVGPDGVILAVYPRVDPDQHAAQVLRDFDRLVKEAPAADGDTESER